MLCKFLNEKEGSGWKMLSVFLLLPGWLKPVFLLAVLWVCLRCVIVALLFRCFASILMRKRDLV